MSSAINSWFTHLCQPPKQGRPGSCHVARRSSVRAIGFEKLEDRALLSVTLWRSEYRINTVQFATSELDGEIGALADGRFAMTWVSDDIGVNDADARFTIRMANGDPVSASFDDEVMSGSGARDEFRVAAAGLPDNRMVFVWDEELLGGGEKDVYAEVRNTNGSTLTDRFEITQPSGVATDDQDRPTVLGLSNGNLMVAYRDTEPATDTMRVRAYDIGGVLQGGNTISSTAVTNSLNNRPQMAELANGNVVVTWSSGLPLSSQQKFSIRLPTGFGVLAEADVNPEDALPEITAGDVVALADGNFVVIFNRSNEVHKIQGRLFDQNGNALGARFNISTGPGGSLAATALQDGRFMVVWENNGNIFGRVMFADGTPDGAQFAINNGVGVQGDPAIATLADGRVVVSWQSLETGTFDIFAEIYDPRETGLKGSASTFNDDWFGTDFADQVYCGAGNDIVRGAGGTDRLYGESGRDTLDGEAGNDRLHGGIDGDILNGDEGNDTLFGQLGDDILNGDSGDDALHGSSGDDVLHGGNNVDSLRGGVGADVFRFLNTGESGLLALRDKIVDFSQSQADLIDVSTIDGKTSDPFSGTFTFIGNAAFSAEGQIRVFQVGATAVIEFNTTGNSGAEMQIALVNFTAANLTVNDFLLPPFFMFMPGGGSQSSSTFDLKDDDVSFIAWNKTTSDTPVRQSLALTRPSRGVFSARDSGAKALTGDEYSTGSIETTVNQDFSVLDSAFAELRSMG